MIPNLPDCPDQRDDCRFIQGASSQSAMHSPVEYDRKGNPVAGGRNTRTKILHCTACGRNWTSTATELDDCQGRERAWVEKDL